MTDITENGLDLPKQQLVDQYLGQISDITSMITEAQNAAKDADDRKPVCWG